MTAWTMTNEMFLIALSQLGLVLGGIAKIWWDWQVRKEDRLDREQDRLDREQLAKLTLEQLEKVETSGDVRLKKIVKEVVETRKVNIHAIKAANNFNEKLIKVKEQIQASPSEVRVINDVTDPVHVHQD